MWDLDGGWLTLTCSLDPGGPCFLDTPCSKGCPYDPAHCQLALPELALIDLPEALEFSSVGGDNTVLGDLQCLLHKLTHKNEA